MTKILQIIAFFLFAAYLARSQSVNHLRIYTNSSGKEGAPTTITIYENATLSKPWSAIKAECSTCHPPQIVQEGVNHSSRTFYLQNVGPSQPINLKKVGLETLDPQILNGVITPPLMNSLTINPNETMAFVVNYECQTDSIHKNKLNGWAILKITLSFGSAEGTAAPDSIVEFSYQKICTLDTISSFDFSLVILLSIATIIVFFGTRHTRTMFADEAENADEVKPVHAVFFIVFASIMLMVFYFLKDYILNIVTGLVCISSVSSCSLILHEIIGKFTSADSSLHRKVKLPCLDEVDVAGIVSFVISGLLVLCWLFTKNWMLNNIIGICIVLLVMRVARISSMKVATLLLGLAFIYDIFWVFISKPIFGDSVMAYVATSLDLPLKLEWPHYRDSPLKGGCGMLGLGDMVLPGLFVAYCYRFDKAKATAVFHSAAVVGYGIGLAICGFFLVVLKLAQPALLYLVPCTIGAVSAVAWKKGLLKDIWVGLDESVTPRQLIINDEEKRGHAGDREDGMGYVSELGQIGGGI